MDLVSLIVTLIIFGIVWWIVQTYILPHTAEPFRTIVIIAIALLVILWLLSLIGVVPRITLPPPK